MKTEEKQKILRRAADELAELIQIKNSDMRIEAACNGEKPKKHDFQTCNDLILLAEYI